MLYYIICDLIPFNVIVWYNSYFHMLYHIFHNVIPLFLTVLYVTKTNSRTRGHDLKILASKSRTNVHMNYLNNRIINIWNNLDYETVHSPSLNCFKSRINKINFNKYLSIMRSIT